MAPAEASATETEARANAIATQPVDSSGKDSIICGISLPAMGVNGITQENAVDAIIEDNVWKPTATSAAFREEM